MPLLRLAVVFLLAGASSAQEPAPATEADRAASFLLRTDYSGRTFALDELGADALEASARRWAKAKKEEAAVLSSVLAAGKSGEALLLPLLDRWQGKYRVANLTSVYAFLSDASAQASKLMAEPGKRKRIEDAIAASENAGVVPGSDKAIERARKLREGRTGNAGLFGADRDPGAIGDPSGDGLTGGSPSGTYSGSGRNTATRQPGVVLGDQHSPPRLVNDPSSYDAAALALSASKLPSSQLPKNITTRTTVVPPKLPTVDMTPKDELINSLASVVNMDIYSRKNTFNEESEEGTKRWICRFLIESNFNPGDAWGLSLAARNAPGADPGDLDLRNAEHYLYAYSTTAKPGGVGDSTAVQLLMAVGWTPFKTVTRPFRPTTKPSMAEMKWGVKGAWHGQHPPDWRKDCSRS